MKREEQGNFNESMAFIRNRNTRNRILNIIRTKGQSYKGEIKKITRYSMVTVLDTIEQLEKEDAIICIGKSVTKNGRRPTYYALNPDACYYFGLAFHATELSWVLVDFCGVKRDFYSEAIPEAHRNKKYVLSRIYAVLADALNKHSSLLQKIKGIGIGSPGYVDEKQGIIIFYSHIPAWQNVPLKSLVEQRVPDIPIYVENNVNAMALLYKWITPAVASSCYVIITIRSGVRMSLLTGTSLHKGKSFTSGEIGHIRTHGGMRYCPCGKRGCLDTEVSEISLRQKLLEGVRVGRFKEVWEMSGNDANKVDIDLFFSSVRLGHTDSLQLLDEICDFLSDGITQIINTINPSNVVISSRYCELKGLFFDRLKKNIWERAIDVSLKGLSLEPIAFGEESLAIGAAALVMENTSEFVDAVI